MFLFSNFFNCAVKSDFLLMIDRTTSFLLARLEILYLKWNFDRGSFVRSFVVVVVFYVPTVL